jgi:hypothetical protein
MNHFHLIKLHQQLKKFRFEYLPDHLNHDKKDRVLSLIDLLQDELEGVIMSDSEDVESRVSGPVKHR